MTSSTFFILSFLATIVFKVFSYLFVVGILFNLLRLYACYNSYMNNIQLDIKPFLVYIFLFFKDIYNLNIILFIYFSITILFSLLCLLLLWREIHKNCLHSVFSLHLVMYSCGSRPYAIPEDLWAARVNIRFLKFNELYADKLGTLAFYYGHRNIISQIIEDNIFKIMDVYNYWYDLPEGSEETKFLKFMSRMWVIICNVRRGDYHWGEYAFYSSPFIVLFYDCIFNNFVINHAFYWFTLYIMFVQLFRIANSVAHQMTYMLGMLFDLYYGPQKYTFLVPVDFKPFFDTYIWNKCTFIREMSGQKNLDFGDFAPYFRFEYINDLEIYENTIGYTLKETSENVYTSEEGEKWIYVGGPKI